jgi:YesN/AraC family two-component response regulator
VTDTEAPTETEAPKTQTILVVDDEADVRALIRDVLSQDGYRVIEAQDCEQALDILRERSTRGLDLALVDCVLPKQSGLEVLLLTKRRWPSIPVVIITGYGSEELAVQALRAGASDYLKKPIEFDTLKAAVRGLTTSGGQGVRRGVAIAAGLGDDLTVVHPNVRRAIVFMREHFTEDITLDDVSRAAALSKFHFSRLFHQETGLPLHEYLHGLRVSRAKVMLGNPHVRITEVAYAIGFNDLSHFDRVFSRIVGQSPSEYRRSLAPTVNPPLPPSAPQGRTAA